MPFRPKRVALRRRRIRRQDAAARRIEQRNERGHRIGREGRGGIVGERIGGARREVRVDERVLLQAIAVEGACASLAEDAVAGRKRGTAGPTRVTVPAMSLVRM